MTCTEDRFYSDLFIFLNAVRVISIVSLLLLFSSSVVTMADDIKAVNRFVAEGKSDSPDSNSTQVNEDYIECVLLFFHYTGLY